MAGSLSFCRLLTLLLVTTTVIEINGCGRKSNPRMEERCDNPSIWDATQNYHHDELFVKRHAPEQELRADENNNLLESIVQADDQNSRVRRNDDLPSHVYRVIRADEDPSQGISARNPNRNVQPTYHVCFGSNQATQYISTTADQAVALQYAQRTNNRMVRINVRAARRHVSILDLRDGNNVTGNTARNFARASEEILMYGGTIPSSAITVVYTP